jgi:O-antigen/teichoic acid export membrane protein
MRSKSFFQGLSLLLLLNLAVKPIWIFFIDRQVQNMAGQVAYGNYFGILNLTIVLSFLTDGGLTNMMNQRIAAGRPVHTFQYIRIKLIMLMAYVMVCGFSGLIFHLQQWELLGYVVLIQVLNSSFVFLRGIITGFQLYSEDAWFSVLDKSLMILSCGSFIYFPFLFGSMNLLLFLQLQTVCTGIALLSVLYFAYKKGLLKTAEKESMQQIGAYVLPFALIYLLMSVHYRLDGFLLDRLHGPYEAGVYASAYRLLDAGNMIGYLAASFLVPFIARNRHEPPVLNSTLLLSRHVLQLSAVLVISFVLVYAPSVQQLLYHTPDAYNACIIQLCLLSLPGYYLVHIYGSVFTATRTFKPFIVILCGAVLLNSILNLLLIPVFGALACCAAAILSQLVCGVACMYAANRVLNLTPHLLSFIIYLATAIALTVLFYISKKFVLPLWSVLLVILAIILIIVGSGFHWIRSKLLTWP